MKILFFALLSAFLFTGCFGENEANSEGVWNSFIYPDKTNNKRSMEFGQFETLEACTKASVQKLADLGLTQRGYIECGLNCSFHEGMKTLVCERVVTK